MEGEPKDQLPAPRKEYPIGNGSGVTNRLAYLKPKEGYVPTPEDPAVKFRRQLTQIYPPEPTFEDGTQQHLLREVINKSLGKK